MKKIFIVIVVLVSLSLLGIIVLQISWLKDSILLNREQVRHSIKQAAIDLSNELTNNLNQRNLNMPDSHSLGELDLSVPLSSINMLNNTERMWKRRYTIYELSHKLNVILKNYGVQNIRYEFGITLLASRFHDFEYETNNFYKEYRDADSSNSLKIVAQIASTQGNGEDYINYSEVLGLLYIIVPNYKAQLLKNTNKLFVFSIIFTLIIISAFYITVKTMLDQKKINKMKTDFFNNLTHEFKTPIATISLAIDALNNVKVLEDPHKGTYFRKVIKEENTRMNLHVETILHAAQLEKKEIQMDVRPVHLHDLLHKSIVFFELQIETRKGEVEWALNASHDEVLIDTVHFANAINNLIDNAIKYSKDHLKITIKTFNKNNQIIFQISDRGIGMSKEALNNIYDAFYREHTGNVHNVKGFGLGMSYVKHVISSHKGTIDITSTVGQGSTFSISINLFKELIKNS